VAVTTVAAVIVAFPQTAEAQGRHVGYHGIVAHGYYSPFYYGYGWPYYSFGWGYAPYGPYAPYGYGPYVEHGYTLGMAAASGLGGVDLNVKPGEAEVWVDGKFRGEAKDLDGSPNLLWLREGSHQIVIYKGGYRSFDETVSNTLLLLQRSAFFSRVELISANRTDAAPASNEPGTSGELSLRLDLVYPRNRGKA
jgi:hypothetical protein